MLDTLRADLRQAYRLLRNRPGFTTIAVATLALGIGANSAIFSVVFGVLLAPLDYQNPDQLALVWRTNVQRQTGNYPVPAPEFLDWTEQNSSFSLTAAVRPEALVLTGTDEPERVIGASVSASLFQLLGASPVLGRTFSSEENTAGNEYVVVLSHGLWRRRFGSDPSVLGSEVKLNGRSHTVVGVMPDGFAFPSQAQLWTPVVFTPEQLADRDWHFLLMVTRLREGTTVADAQRDLDQISARLARAYPETNEGWTGVVQPLHDAAVGNSRATIWMLFGAVSFVLLIACANVANLLLARAAGRQRELCVRAALGAGRSRLVRQLLVESVVLALVGGAVGAALAYLGIDVLVAAAGSSLPRSANVSLNGMVLAATLAMALVTGIVFGLVPALHGSRFDLTEGLKEGTHGAGISGRRSRLGRILVAGEIAVALVLVVGAGLMIQSFRRLLEVDPGFNPSRTLTFQVQAPSAQYPESEQVLAFADELQRRLAATPGVVSVGLNPWIPMTGGGPQFRYRLASDQVGPVNDMPIGMFRPVSPGYFATMEIPLVAGRTFRDDDRAGQVPVAIVNEAFVRRHFADGEDPLGRRVVISYEEPNAPEREIVGVVRDVKNAGLTSDPVPVYYVPFRQIPWNTMTLAVRTTGEPGAITPAVRAIVGELDPDIPVTNIATMEERLSQVVAQPRFRMQLLGVFAAVALILAAVGVYGVMAYAVSQRTQEIGVRLALGARPAAVRRMVVKEALAVGLIGVLVGLAGALALSRLVSGMLFEVQATEPVVYLTVAGILTAVAVTASLVPALRASRVDPMAALRE